MQHHRVEYAEQIEVDHAKMRTLRLDIIRALFGFFFFQRSQVSLLGEPFVFKREFQAHARALS